MKDYTNDDDDSVEAMVVAKAMRVVAVMARMLV